MAKVHEDKHGVFVKVGGYVFRPVYPVGYRHFLRDGSNFVKGNTPQGKHRGGPLVKLTYNGVSEEWFNHGPYMGPGSSPNSEDCFKPDHEVWSLPRD